MTKPKGHEKKTYFFKEKFKEDNFGGQGINRDILLSNLIDFRKIGFFLQFIGGISAFRLKTPYKGATP